MKVPLTRKTSFLLKDDGNPSCLSSRGIVTMDRT